MILFWLCGLQAALRAMGMAGQRERSSLVIPELWEPSAREAAEAHVCSMGHAVRGDESLFVAHG